MSIVFDRKDVDTADRGDGQQKTYLALPEEERRKGFVRSVRRSYQHVGAPSPKYQLRDLTPEEHERYDQFGYVKRMDYPEGSPERASGAVGRFYTKVDLDRVGAGCGTVTTMAIPLAQTYAREPGFYSGTFCSGCGRHLPVGADGEFVWVGSEERVGT